MLLGPVMVAALSGELCANEYFLCALLKGTSYIFIFIHLLHSRWKSKRISGSVCSVPGTEEKNRGRNENDGTER